MENIATWVIFGVPVFILAGTVHEYMHAWTAKKLGDYTATIEGRLTLNPLAHLDPFGLLLMVVAGFGWMKPVPVNSYNFKDPIKGMALVAVAGPASNLVMALIGAVIFNLLFNTDLLASADSQSAIYTFVENFSRMFVWINIVLMVFNMIPFPPLDGSRIVRIFMPENIRYKWEELEKYSPFILLILFIIPPFSLVTGTLITTVSEAIFNALI
jgi:Zn-dependent protease